MDDASGLDVYIPFKSLLTPGQSFSKKKEIYLIFSKDHGHLLWVNAYGFQ